MTLANILLMLGLIYRGHGTDDRNEIAESIEAAKPTRAEAAWLAAIAFRESSYRMRAVGDRGSSFCWAQINLPNGRRTSEGWSGFELTAEPEKCAVVALRSLRGSLGICRHLPLEERLAAYAGGSCDSEYGRRISRDRYRLAVRAAGGAL